ncbi:MAG: response regulator [Rhodospirillaceae bacterium]|jgi:phosphoribosyl 1,2-cyclic phosphodiesterase/ActR/RegA family two-component response regulator|nr:response regulator [Rhodospirillaceae bacterium]MBT5245899.1 response regulator [Rhodospirillaceae bacterium]MBT5561824.1 response regulator [Rhodospirillaceae bacterium]MBT6240938.1 response regulator [Rhodospirillaceae bacterium]MBT7139103.1 response regulator [Rhodospirillaceae bacterium]
MSDTAKLNFFVVDDDPEMAEFMATLLIDGGHQATFHTDSTIAIDQIADAKPDCVLFDLMMPGLDGMEWCAQLRQHPELAKTKLIVVSSKSYHYDRKRAFDSGIDGFITKPIREKTFVDTVNRILEDMMDLSFWGVRGTLPVPGEKSIRYGGNTSCVTIEFSRGDFLIFDAGSGIKELSNWMMGLGKKKIEAKIFISHPHWDHINALPFFVPLYIQGNIFEVFGPRHDDITVHQLISAQMDGVYFPITIQEFASSVTFRDLHEEVLEFDGITIRTMLLHHPGQCLGYRIEYKGRSICYITDNELFLESDEEHYDPFYVKRLVKFIEGADALITDSTYTDEEYANGKVGWGHSCIGQVVDLAAQAKVKTLYLFHHDPDQDDDAIDAKLATARTMLEDMGSSVVCEAPTDRTHLKI